MGPGHRHRFATLGESARSDVDRCHRSAQPRSADAPTTTLEAPRADVADSSLKPSGAPAVHRAAVHSLAMRRARARGQLRALLVGLLVVGIAFAALSAASHSHAHQQPRDEGVVGISIPGSIADDDSGAPAVLGASEPDGVCLGIAIAALALLAIARILLAQGAVRAAEPVAEPTPKPRPLLESNPRPPELSELAVYRQ